MKRLISGFIVTFAALAVITGFQNCSDVSFDQDKGTGSSQNAAGNPNGGGPVDGGIPQNGGTTGGPIVTGGPGGTTNPVNVPPGFPPPPPGSTDAPPVPPPGSTFPPGTPIPPGTILPRVVQVEPPCQRLQWCEYELQLDKGYPMVVDFNWRTNDDPARAANVRPGSIRAVANTHYIPGSGHVTFLPGETVRKVYVLNINPDPAINITIPFIFSQCQYGRVGVNCTAIFR